MYSNRIPFTRSEQKGPQAPKRIPASKPAIKEPAKIEVEPVDLLTTEVEPEAQETLEETTDGDN